MSLLSDEEKNAVYLQWLTRTGDMLLLIDLTEAAILAKLASAELPEPAIFQYDAMLASPIKAYTADQLRQAYAQGAAAQLDRLEKAEKDAERYRWLRNGPLVDGEICEELYVAVDSPKWPSKWALVGSDLDKAVDAMEASK